MTIEFQGHVEKVEVTTGDRVKVHFHLSLHRTKGPFVVEMSRAEMKQYLPGSGVMVQLRPYGEVGNPL